MRRLLRPWCWLVGHDSAATMLPEREFGLYAYSRLFSGRCGYTIDATPALPVAGHDPVDVVRAAGGRRRPHRPKGRRRPR